MRQVSRIFHSQKSDSLFTLPGSAKTLAEKCRAESDKTFYHTAVWYFRTLLRSTGSSKDGMENQNLGRYCGQGKGFQTMMATMSKLESGISLFPSQILNRNRPKNNRKMKEEVPSFAYSLECCRSALDTICEPSLPPNRRVPSLALFTSTD